MVCIRCQKRPAIIFVQRMENGQMKNEGYCLHCAREMHIKPVDDLMKQFGMSDEDMDAMEDRMENMMQEMGDMSSMNPFSMMMGMGQPDQSEEDGDLVPGSSATFPLGVNGGAQNGKNEKKAGKNEKKPPRRKFLDTYCENLTRKAREGKLDDIIGRDREATKEMCGQVIYPAAVMKNALHAEAAKEFLAYLRTDKAATVFESVGFTAL